MKKYTISALGIISCIVLAIITWWDGKIHITFMSLVCAQLFWLHVDVDMRRKRTDKTDTMLKELLDRLKQGDEDLDDDTK